MNTPEVFIHSLSQWSFGLSYILETTFGTIDEIDQITQFTCNLIFRWEIFALLLVEKLLIESIFFIFGQYVHLPSLVQTGIKALGLRGLCMGGKLILAEVSLSLKLGSLLNPIIGGSGKMV